MAASRNLLIAALISGFTFLSHVVFAQCVGMTSSVSITRSIGCGQGWGSNASWDGPIGGTINDPGGGASNFDVTWTTSGTFRFKRTFPSGCAAQVIYSNYFTIGDPVGGTLSGPSDIFYGSVNTDLFLSGHNGSVIEYRYSENGGSPVVVSSTSASLNVAYSNNTMSPIVRDYWAVVRHNGCDKTSSVVTITVNPKPTPSRVVCVGDVTDHSITRSIGCSYGWGSNASGGGIINDPGGSSSNFSVTWNMPGYFTLYRTFPSGCAATIIYGETVQVKPKPTTPAPSELVQLTGVCGQVHLTYTGTLSSTYWQEATAPYDETFPVNRTVTATGTYYARSKFDGCWSDRRAFTVNSLPGTPVGGTLLGGAEDVGTVNAFLTLVSYSGNIKEYRYKENGGSEVVLPGNTASIFVDFSTTGPTLTRQYWAVLELDGCEVPSSIATVVARAVPAPTRTVCVGDVTDHSITRNIGCSYGLGYNASGGGIVNDPGGSASGFSVTWTTPGIYTLRRSFPSGCSTTVIYGETVRVNPIPAPPSVSDVTTEINACWMTLKHTGSSNAYWQGTPERYSEDHHQNHKIYSAGDYFLKVKTDGCWSSALTYNVASVPMAPRGGQLNGGGTFPGWILKDLTLTGYQGGVREYWYRENGGNPVKISNTTDRLMVALTNPTSATIVREYWAVLEGWGCEDISSIATVTLTPLPNIGNPDITYTCTPGGNSVILTSGKTTDRWFQTLTATVPLAASNSIEVPLTAGVYFVGTITADGRALRVPYEVDQTFASRCSDHLNLIKVYKPQVPLNALSLLEPVEQVQKNITYFDGVGRSIQEIAIQSSPLFKDVVRPIVYDGNGREYRQYLPFVSAEGNGGFKDVSFTAAGNYTHNFYNNASDKIADDSRPFAESMFEASPLNRVTKQYGPGADWSPTSNNKFIGRQYLLNVFASAAPYPQNHERIIFWEINASGMPVRKAPMTSTVAAGGYYMSSQLTINVITDEHGNQVREYTDKNGRVILKKVQAVASPALDNRDHWALTYYVYDDFGNLRFVLQPELSTSIHSNDSYTPTVTDLNNLAFQYRYDGRGRMIEKQVPGAAPIHMVYDVFDRLVLTQDGNQRGLATPEWTFVKYDGLNRAVLTGILASANSRAAMVDDVNGYYNSLTEGKATHETYIGSLAGNVLGFDNKSFPQVSEISRYLTATYYDIYDAYIAPPATPGTEGYGPLTQNLPDEVTGNQNRIVGQVTGMQVKNLATGAWMRTVNYYDHKYRVIQTIADHHKGTVRTSNVYDFAGKLRYTQRRYTVDGIVKTIKETFIYDHAGRQLSVKHSIDGTTEVTLSVNEYNELGQLVSKKLHKTGETGSPVTPDPAVGQPGVAYGSTLDLEAYNSAQSTQIASSSIRLLPGFHVPSGSVFNARIGYSQQDAENHNNAINANVLQKIDYRYNIRGWLMRINNADVGAIATADGDAAYDFFGMEMAYNTTVSGLTAEKLYNGNISAIKWSKGSGTPVASQAYAFTYDPMNRLTTASHFDYKRSTASWISNNNGFGESQTYDLNGNIRSLVRKGYMGSNLDNLGYSYTGNRLNYVNDEGGDPNDGFVNLNTGTDDYAYDANGNLYKDRNKGINNNGDIKYNHLNLPEEVIKGTERIKYIYDAKGTKLAQEVYTADGTKRTDYIGELVYEGTSGTLQFIQHSEGRAVPDGNSWEYQYHLKDHLGNVRVTFTAKPPVPVNYSTNFEGSDDGVFRNYNPIPYDLVDHTDAGNVHTRVQKLDGGENGRVGLAKSVTVMPGDVISVTAYGKYMNLSSSPNTTSFITALGNAFDVSAGSTGEQLRLFNGLSSFAAMVPSGDRPLDDETAPKAFVTILLFDSKYNLLDATWDQMTTTGLQSSSTVKQPPHDVLSAQIKAEEAGFAYIFLSNEHPTTVEVFFDDVTVTHTPSRILSANDYYPFGLSYNSHTRENTVSQDYKYNGKEEQTELGLGWLDYGKRFYNPEIGRWIAMDQLTEVSKSLTPYRYGFNNPVRFLDPNGLYETDGHYWTVYLMGRLLGVTNAQKIAYYAEYPDNVMSSQGDIVSERWTWAEPFYHQPVVHALTGENAVWERALSSSWALKAATVGDFGQHLHRLGDSFAHTRMDGSGNTYPGPLGHAFEGDGHVPDKISNRPELYMQYVRQLANVMSQKFGTDLPDFFTFQYIAYLKGTTQQNSAILETEVRLLEGQRAFSVAGNEVGTIRDYMKARNDKYQSVNIKVGYVEVERYTRNKNGKWTSRTEYRTVVNWGDE